MTYLTFLLSFVIAPALLLIAALHWYCRSDTDATRRLRWHWGGATILAAIALAWTTPWDNYIIAHDVWSYGEDRVLATLGLVPVEEYGFMMAMPFFNAAIMGWLMARQRFNRSRWRERQTRGRQQALLFYSLLWLAGLACLPFEPAFYLSAILIWFVPPLALQASFDPSVLARHWCLVAIGTLIPTLYFSLVDAFAIKWGIWTIHNPTRTGLELAGLPFEEALFFFTTSLLLAQGLVLWHALPQDREQ